MLPQILESLVSNIVTAKRWSCHKHISLCSISVFSLCREMRKWPPEIQKITIKWNWYSNGSNLLVFDHFDCFYNDLHHERCQRTPCSPKITQGLKLQTLLLLRNITPKGLTNRIRNIPKKPSTQSYREVLSFC